MTKFKVGDIITGKQGVSQYKYTTSDAVMRVTDVKVGREIQVLITAHTRFPNLVDENYRVDEKYFELVKKAPKSKREEFIVKGRRTFRLLKDTHIFKKGALVQEECEDGTQPYTVITPEFFKGELEGEMTIAERSLVEEQPQWFVEVFKVNPEYMTKEELDKYKLFRSSKKSLATRKYVKSGKYSKKGKK